MRSFLAVALFAFSGAAWAQSAEVWFSAGQSLLSSSLGADPNVCPTSATCQAIGESSNDVQLTNGFRFSFRITLNQGNHFGHEAQYAYNRTQLKFNDQAGAEQGMAIHQGIYNFLLYGTGDDSRVRPFVTGGVGFNNFVPPGSSAAQGGGTTKLGFNYGAGVKFKVSSLFGVRLDFRQYTMPKPFDLPLSSGWIHQTEISAGFGVIF